MLRAFRPLSVTILIVICVSSVAYFSWLSKPNVAPAKSGSFQDVTLSAGINFQYDNDAHGQHRFIETVGGGCAFIDFDGDGLLDIFAVQGGPSPGSANRQRPHPVLYRNLGNGRFLDVTESAGLSVDTGFAQGVSVADYDNDGWPDLLITSYGGVHLFHNDHGHFREVTREAGLVEKGDPHWCTSAAWADYDHDGKLDLFVCHYASWFPDMERPCWDDQQRSIYCAPTSYAADVSVLYRNLGGGRFEDATSKAGLSKITGKALGAIWLDANGDGWSDLFIANDMMPNVLLMNQKNGTFRDEAPAAGVSLPPGGQPLSGMGVTAGDFRNVGLEDIFVVNFSRQPRSYYLNSGSGSFEWGSALVDGGNSEQPMLAFGAESLDYDLDGKLDLVIGNGHLNEVLEEPVNGVAYRQRQQLMHNIGNGRLVDNLADAGDLALPRITRGLAVGDFNNDGRPDILVSGPKSKLTLFQNTGRNNNHWIGFTLQGIRSNRDGVGAVVTIRTSSTSQMRTIRSGSSYASASDHRALFGLGAQSALPSIEVKWPLGKTTSHKITELDRYYLLNEDGNTLPARSKR